MAEPNTSEGHTRSPSQTISRYRQRFNLLQGQGVREDSTSPTPTLSNSEFPAPAAKFPHLFHRIGSLRGHRRPATSGPSGDFARYNPAPAPIPSHYPAPCPGQAARAAAAAANNERERLLKQQLQEGSYQNDLVMDERAMDDVLKDSESGVGMSCTDLVEEEEEDLEPKFGMCSRL
jgi:F-box and WD-40 domain protein 1/11